MIKHSAELWKMVYEQSAIGIAFEDIKGNFIDSNERLCEILEYTLDEISKLNTKDITHPADGQANEKIFERIRNGEISHAEMLKRYITKTGKMVWARLTVIPIMEDNKVEYVVCQVQPINGDRHKIEKIGDNSLQVRPTVHLLEFIADNWKSVATILTLTFSSIIGFSVEYIRQREKTNILESEIKTLNVEISKQNDLIMKYLGEKNATHTGG